MMRAFRAVLLLAVLSGPAAALDLVLEVPNPTEGRALKVLLTGPEAGPELRLTAIYRPGSRTQAREEVGTFDADGAITWRPAYAGITHLVVSDPDDPAAGELASRNVAVRFRSPPPQGIAILLFAGGLLFGGATLAMRWSLEGEIPSVRRGKRPRGAPST
ncbi:MAG: hypothetical protein ABIH26_14435 [Candidatus Eisenbacteria bacterium]